MRKVPLYPSKDRFIKEISLSAESDSGLCLKQRRFSCLPRVLQGCKTNQANNTKHLPPFEKGGRKLLVLRSKHFRLTSPNPISPNILKGHDNRKKLVATAQRRERIYKRTAEPSVTFCGEEE